MRQLILFLSLVSTCHGAMSLLQSALGGNVSGTNTCPYTLTTGTGNFSSNTTAGSLLVLAVYGKEHAHTAGQFSGIIFQNPTTSGVTWVNAIFNGWNDGVPTNGGNLSIYYAANAPSISSGTTTTVQANVGCSGAISDLTAEFALYEFSGIRAVSPLDVTKGPAGGSGTPTVGTLTTTFTDLVIVAFQGNSSNISAGGAYTLGVNMANATVGQLQYALNVTAGGQNTDFSGSQTNYGALAASFKAPSVPASGQPRRRGWIF